MRRSLLFILVSILSFCNAIAQSWSATLDMFDGLPGEEKYTEGTWKNYYYFKSGNFTPGGTLDIIRLTVTATSENETANGNNVFFTLSGLSVYDGNGNKIGYEASSNADHNSLVQNENDKDGQGLTALSDNDVETYFHSMWRTPAVTDYHYIELKLEKAISTFSLEWTSRVMITKNAPTAVGITLGTEYTPESSEGGTTIDFALGDAVTAEEGLAAEKQFFVLKGNAVTNFTQANGTIWNGSGPIFMSCAESGDKEASASHIMQLIPAGKGEYLVYWPASQKFLKDSNEASNAEYNGTNGWQLSTSDIIEAAKVKITSTGDGFFEMQYSTTYNNSPITFYIGAEMRDNVASKMKTFDLEHKQYLENGDYNKGFSLPIAFNWSIYKADVSETTFEEISLSPSAIASSILSPVISSATSYLNRYGDIDGLCAKNENIILQNKIDEGNALINGNAADFSSITAKKEEIQTALAAYLTVKLDKYSSDVNKLLTESKYSAAPNFAAGTYPESSKDILNSTLKTIENAKSNIATYTAEQFDAVLTQVERDIDLFNSTLITEVPGAGDGGSEESPIDENVICIYLKNGDIDMFEVSAMDGEHYIEGDKLYVPLKDNELMYYTSDEYDSCSTVKPALPTMTSYKFNNKYNPNLNVDVVAENIAEEINLSLNAIGKWLTASFTLSDDKAVAYVDTVLQVSKETRQSFADGVTYRVTYPGYNIIRRVKVQDEIWSEPSTGEPQMISLTASMITTNKEPVNSSESIDMLLDNDPNTYFHSTWGKNYDASVLPYLQIDLTESVEMIQLYYMTRSNIYGTGYRNPTGFEIHVSSDGSAWTKVRTFTADADGLPVQQPNGTYTTPTVDLGGKYSKIRFVQTSCEYSKNHLALAELRLYKVSKEITESTKLQDAVYANKRIPYGNEYRVNVAWLTDIINKVPRIDIDIDGGERVTSKSYYLNAKFRITGFGIYENFEDSVQIKGRGNSTWNYPKKPYRLKFAEKVKPFGLTKGKSWVLLANYQSGSQMANAISMKIGQMSGAEYTNHIIPVELYMNGDYMGSYMFTEKVGMANNSVDVDEGVGHLLELDTNSDDEYQFTSSSYGLPVFVKEPDLTDSSTPNIETRKANIKRQFNEFCNALYNGQSVDSHVDMNALAGFMLAYDLALNQELGHPKSVFLFKENEDDTNSKYKFGPIWDFDWGYGYENGHSYCTSSATSSVLNYSMSDEPGYIFFNDLLNADSFKKHYYKVWNDFINSNSIDELLDYIDCYYSFAKESFQNDDDKWGNSFTESDKERHKSWLTERHSHIYNNLDKYELDDIIYTLTGDVNCNNMVTIHDAALIAAHINGNTDSNMNTVKADCDKNGNIEIADARMVAELVKSGDAPSPTYWYSSQLATGNIYANDFILDMGNVETVQLKLLSYDDEPYKAMQMDIELPSGVMLIDLQGENALSGHNFSYIDKGNNQYRLIAYSDEDKSFTTGDDAIVNLTVTATGIVNEENRNIEVKKAFVIDENNAELRLGDYNIAFSQATGIGYTGANELIEGGEFISVTLLKAEEIAVYSVDGRKIRTVKAKAGTTRINVPAGIYIVKGKKVTVR